jgi:acetyl-CoA synthetase
VPLKAISDDALKDAPSIEAVVVVKRTGSAIAWKEGRDRWWSELIQDTPPAALPSPRRRGPLYILYTSGTTETEGHLHTTGGYLVGTYATSKWVFDLKDEDIYWCTADIGGSPDILRRLRPARQRRDVLMYEGAPDLRDATASGTSSSATASRSLHRADGDPRVHEVGRRVPDKHDLSRSGCSARRRADQSRGLDVVPREHRHGTLPIVDTWWQTETGMILITPLPGSRRPGPARRRRLPGSRREDARRSGRGSEGGGGYSRSRVPGPRCSDDLGDDRRYVETYWSKWGRIYFPGDGAKRDRDGYFWLLGRVDDVMNVAVIASARWRSSRRSWTLGRRRGRGRGRPDELKGTAIAAFVILKEKTKTQASGRRPQKELQAHVAKKIGALARPDKVFFTADLPKTRSGKIMRRLLRDIRRGTVSATRRRPRRSRRRRWLLSSSSTSENEE